MRYFSRGDVSGSREVLCARCGSVPCVLFHKLLCFLFVWNVCARVCVCVSVGVYACLVLGVANGALSRVLCVNVRMGCAWVVLMCCHVRYVCMRAVERWRCHAWEHLLSAVSDLHEP